jgi:hypothetical protein
VLAKAREEIKNSWAFKRLLEKVGMSEGEADKRLAVARSARISSEEFQLKIMPRVTGYSNLAALESLTDVAYQRLLSDLGSDTKITKSMIDSVSQGNTPGDKLLSGVVLKFSRQSLSQLTPAQQVENRSIIAAIQELAGKPGCIFKLTVRKNLLTLLGDKSERKQS